MSESKILEDELYDRLCILTPARVVSSERYEISAISLESLYAQISAFKLKHFIVQDNPDWGRLVPKRFTRLFSALSWSGRAKRLYEEYNAVWMKGMGKGSAHAMLLAVEAAIKSGKSYGFIHLDDHVYCEPFAELMKSGLHAMSLDDNLIWTRFSGYPIMFDGRVPFESGDKERILFDQVVLSPQRKLDYTLWHAPIDGNANCGRYWPIALWFCIYRLDALKAFLEWALENNVKHLAHAEEYFKERDGFERVINRYPNGRFGYINMQFGGFEMHRNPRWRELIAGDNKAVL